MTIKQKILRFIYPFIIKMSKSKSMNTKVLKNTDDVKPQTSVYDILFEMNNNQTETLAAYKGKKILIVNTASNCGYTHQYKSLQKLYEQSADKVQLIAFPSNNFKEQEKGSDKDIAQFCKVNYGVTFPLAKKSDVIKTKDQNKIFKWLSNANANGWLTQAPTWNFCKYLIDEQGVLTHFFEAAIEPLSKEIAAAINS